VDKYGKRYKELKILMFAKREIMITGKDCKVACPHGEVLTKALRFFMGKHIMIQRDLSGRIISF